MEIKPMTIRDYPGLFALWKRTPGMGMRSLDDTREGIARFLRRNPSTCFTAWEGDSLVGAVLAGHDGRRGSIYHACVDGDCRRRGIGSALVEASLEALRGEGINKVAFVVFRDNETGNGFWKGTGWELRTDLNYYNKSLNPGNV